MEQAIPEDGEPLAHGSKKLSHKGSPKEDWRKLAESMPDEAMSIPLPKGHHAGAKAASGDSGKKDDHDGGDNASEASSDNDNDGQGSIASSAQVEKAEEVS